MSLLRYTHTSDHRTAEAVIKGWLGSAAYPRHVSLLQYSHILDQGTAHAVYGGSYQDWRLVPRHVLPLRRSRTADRLATLAVNDSIGRLFGVFSSSAALASDALRALER